jgi:hypothetical protein
MVFGMLVRKQSFGWSMAMDGRRDDGQKITSDRGVQFFGISWRAMTALPLMRSYGPKNIYITGR